MAQITEDLCREIVATRGVTAISQWEKEQLARAWLDREQIPEATSAEHQQLFKFYGVETLAALADAQARHIESRGMEQVAPPKAAPARDTSDGDPTPDPNAAPTLMSGLTQAAQDVLAERQRQITAEGWTPEHDDEHRDGEMAIAAACYVLHGTPPDSEFAVCGTPLAQYLFSFTGWPPHSFKPKGKRHNLKIATALLLADMERRDRIDDVIWVPCRGCTDLAGCEEHRACLTLDGWEVGINGLTEAETSATASVMGVVGMQAPGVGGPTYYVRHPDETYSVADPQPAHGVPEVDRG